MRTASKGHASIGLVNMGRGMHVEDKREMHPGETRPVFFFDR